MSPNVNALNPQSSSGDTGLIYINTYMYHPSFIIIIIINIILSILSTNTNALNPLYNIISHIYSNIQYSFPSSLLYSRVVLSLMCYWL